MFEHEIMAYLEKYQELWYFLTKKYYSINMDVVGNVMDEYDYYGCDFSGDKRVFQPFFSGCSDHFCGIPIYDKDVSTIPNLDEYPVYHFDLSSGEKPFLIGNFKTFMKEDLCLYKTEEEIKYKTEHQEALAELELFSDNLIAMDEYKLIINDVAQDVDISDDDDEN